MTSSSNLEESQLKSHREEKGRGVLSFQPTRRPLTHPGPLPLPTFPPPPSPPQQTTHPPSLAHARPSTAPGASKIAVGPCLAEEEEDERGAFDVGEGRTDVGELEVVSNSDRRPSSPVKASGER